MSKSFSNLNDVDHKKMRKHRTPVKRKRKMQKDLELEESIEHRLREIEETAN